MTYKCYDFYLKQLRGEHIWKATVAAKKDGVANDGVEGTLAASRRQENPLGIGGSGGKLGKHVTP